jgi:hypothetical protein
LLKEKLKMEDEGGKKRKRNQVANYKLAQKSYLYPPTLTLTYKSLFIFFSLTFKILIFSVLSVVFSLFFRYFFYFALSHVNIVLENIP